MCKIKQRLLHGDVYFAERLYRFGLSESDRCKRCFEKETIMHLCVDCPYTRSIFSLLQDFRPAQLRSTFQ